MSKITLLSFFLISFSLVSKAQDSVSVNFKVTVPPSTPERATVFWAGSLNHWNPGNNLIPHSSPKPLHKSQRNWRITLKAPKGDTVAYKYSRGSMFSVEEQDDFTYQPLRKVVFDQTKTVDDTISAWHDRPPKGLRSNWPKVALKPTEQTISLYGSVQNTTGTILLDKARGSTFTDMSRYDTKTNDIPNIIDKHVFYFLKLSEAKDNTVLVMAGKKARGDLWHVYIDQNNDNSIGPNEEVFTIQSDTSRAQWIGPVHFQKIVGKKSVDDTVRLGLQHAVKLPSKYRSTDVKGAPDLTYSLPLKQRKATLNDQNFYLITLFTQPFSKFFYLAVDQDHNDTLRLASGSNEMSLISLNQMVQRQRYYIYPKFKLGNNYWEVVTVNPQGTSMRLRPARNFKAKIDLSPGKPAPEWKATTIDGNQIGSKSLQGQYVFLNFWGSWCGGCVQEIPTLKKAYKKFKDEDLTVIGFDYGDTRSMLSKAMVKYKLPWSQIFDQNGTYKTKFSVFGFPTNYLIGPDGKVLATGDDLRGEKLLHTLKHYLK